MAQADSVHSITARAENIARVAAFIAAQSPHFDMTPIRRLAFVRNSRDAKPAHLPLHFWTVRPTGDYGHDAATGGRYAKAALAALPIYPVLLLRVADDMRTRRASAINIGFWLAIADHIARQNATVH